MKKLIGRVTQVFIPDEYVNNNLVDIMDRTKIGFKVMTDNGLLEVILEQNIDNAKIMKDDLVIITYQEISGRQFIDIELCGEEYE